jgi:hypothetical protein
MKIVPPEPALNGSYGYTSPPEAVKNVDSREITYLTKIKIIPPPAPF